MNTTKSLTQLSKEFLEQHDVNKLTRLQYQSNLRQLIKFIRENSRSERNIKKRDIIDFKWEMQEQGRSAATVASYLTTFRMFFQHLRDINLMHENIMTGIKYPKKDKRFKKLPLTKEHVLRLMKSIDTSTPAGLRDSAMIKLMIYTGLRTVEVSRIRIKDVDWKNDKRILYIKQKGHTDYDNSIDLPDEVWDNINNYLVTRDVDFERYMFLSYSNRNKGYPLTARRIGVIVTNYLQKANIKSKYYTAHSLRHTAAMQYLRMHNKDYEKLRVFMRHESANTTQVYTHMYKENLYKSKNEMNISGAFPELENIENETAK